MKKLIFIFLAVLLFAADKNEYLEMTNKLMNYHLKLDGVVTIKSPFEYKQPAAQDTQAPVQQYTARKIIKIEVVSIFDRKAYILIEKYLGTQLVSKTKKWVKPGDKIEECKILNVTDSKVTIRCKGKTLVKSVNIKNPFSKELR